MICYYLSQAVHFSDSSPYIILSKNVIDTFRENQAPVVVPVVLTSGDTFGKFY